MGKTASLRGLAETHVLNKSADRSEPFTGDLHSIKGSAELLGTHR